MLDRLARRAFLLACGLTALVAAAPAAVLAKTKTETASSGIVTASFSFDVSSRHTYPTKTLAISRSGRTVYRQPVSSTYCGPVASPNAQKYCAPGYVAPGHSSVHVLALQPGAEPSVVLDLYTGGAHCCSIEQVYSFDPATGTYVLSEHDFGDPGASLVDLGHNGAHEFLTADDTYAYAFTDFAASGLPIKILAFAQGRFTDVTRQYPNLIVKDAATYLKAFKHDIRDGEGLIAAWAADEDSLGHRDLVAATLAKYLKAGELRGGTYSSAKKFIRALNRLLKKDGYVS